MLLGKAALYLCLLGCRLPFTVDGSKKLCLTPEKYMQWYVFSFLRLAVAETVLSCPSLLYILFCMRGRQQGTLQHLFSS